MKKLIKIQAALKAPKNQFNHFGKYKYRSCEDILEAVKPLLIENEALLTLSDEVVEINGKTFVKATAQFYSGDFSHSVTAFARHAEIKKGMDDSQITGTASSYARKYALSGLLLIDDNKDADTQPPPTPKKPELNPSNPKWNDAKNAIFEGKTTVEKIKEYFYISNENIKLLEDE